jgi:peptide/nickel transport system substrate-binding protein
VVSLATLAAPSTERTVRLAITAMPPAKGHPYRNVATTANFVLPALYDTLVTFNNQGQVVPRLATHWENRDPLTWVFHLRRGVVFSNGEPLTAQGLAAVWNALREGEAASYTLAREVEPFAAITAENDHTLVIRLHEPNALLPQYLHTLYAAPAGYWAKVGWDGIAEAPIGTGPFVVESWSHESIAMRANPSSWRAPKIDTLAFRVAPEPTARLQALLTGQVDAIIAVDPEQEPVLVAEGMRVHQRKGMRILCIALDTTTPGSPMADARVRRALNHAVNKQRIADALWNGRVTPATQGAITDAFGYDQALQSYAYDPAKARALLKEAGYETGFSFTFEFPAGTLPGDSAIMQQIAADLAAVGVRMNIRPITYAQQVRYTSQGGWKGEATLQDYVGYSYDALRPYIRGGHSCSGMAPWFCDPRIQPTIDAAAREPDLKKREALTREVLRYYHAEAETLLLFPVLGLDGVSPRITHWEPWSDQIQFHLLDVQPDP